MTRVLVTGSNGFIGKHTLGPLESAGFEVHRAAGDLLAPGAAAALIESVRPSHLLHLAWETTHGSYWTSPLNERWAEASIALARAFFAAGGSVK